MRRSRPPTSAPGRMRSRSSWWTTTARCRVRSGRPVLSRPTRGHQGRYVAGSHARGVPRGRRATQVGFGLRRRRRLRLPPRRGSVPPGVDDAGRSPVQRRDPRVQRAGLPGACLASLAAQDYPTYAASERSHVCPTPSKSGNPLSSPPTSRHSTTSCYLRDVACLQGVGSARPGRPVTEPRMPSLMGAGVGGSAT